MSRVWVTSDWHLGHSGITRFRKQFHTDEAHDAAVISMYHDMGVTKRDVVFMLGDMAFTETGLMEIARLPGRKILVRGNHDDRSEALTRAVFDEIHGAYRYKNCFLTHIPIHPMELYGGYNVHGHCHRGGPNNLLKGAEWGSYYNAILEFNNYQMVPMDHVLRVLRIQTGVEK